MGSDHLFNPYIEVNADVDLPHANDIRQENLQNYLNSFTSYPDILLLGEAPGWRGCRFSGIPFTSEAQLIEGELPFHGSQTSNSSIPHQEITATTFWKFMKPYHPRFLVWNCIPFHPSKPGKPLSNRQPTRDEIACSLPLLIQLIDMIDPKQVIAVGRTAQHTLHLIERECEKVRHPAHGGANEFRRELARILQSSFNEGKNIV